MRSRIPTIATVPQELRKKCPSFLWIGSDVVNFVLLARSRNDCCLLSQYLPCFARLVVLEHGDGANRFLRLSGHSQRVHDQTEIVGNSQHERQRVKGETICILKQDHVLHSIVLPLFGNAVFVHQLVNVAVPMRFGLDTSKAFGIKHHPRIIVVQCRYSLSLLHDCNLFLVHAKVIVLFEEFHGLLVGISRGHDAEGQLSTRSSKLLLDSENVLNVMLQVARLTRHFCGEADLLEADGALKK